MPWRPDPVSLARDGTGIPLVMGHLWLRLGCAVESARRRFRLQTRSAMLRMTPHQFAFEIVFPTVRSFLAARHDRRLAYLSCIATFHLVDHIAQADAIEKWRVCDAMRLACSSDFEVIQGICEGRLQSGNRDAEPQQVHGSVGRIPSGGFGMGRFAVEPRCPGGPEAEQHAVHACVVAVLKHFAQLYPHHFNGQE
jgi:hypothetical protein